MPKINREQLFSWETPLPPVGEQRRLTGILQEKANILQGTREAIGKSLRAIEALPAAILREAFRGEL